MVEQVLRHTTVAGHTIVGLERRRIVVVRHMMQLAAQEPRMKPVVGHTIVGLERNKTVADRMTVVGRTIVGLERHTTAADRMIVGLALRTIAAGHTIVGLEQRRPLALELGSSQLRPVPSSCCRLVPMGSRMFVRLERTIAVGRKTAELVRHTLVAGRMTVVGRTIAPAQRMTVAELGLSRKAVERGPVRTIAELEPHRTAVDRTIVVRVVLGTFEPLG